MNKCLAFIIMFILGLYLLFETCLIVKLQDIFHVYYGKAGQLPGDPNVHRCCKHLTWSLTRRATSYYSLPCPGTLQGRIQISAQITKGQVKEDFFNSGVKESERFIIICSQGLFCPTFSVCLGKSLSLTVKTECFLCGILVTTASLKNLVAQKLKQLFQVINRSNFVWC